MNSSRHLFLGPTAAVLFALFSFCFTGAPSMAQSILNSSLQTLDSCLAAGQPLRINHFEASSPPNIKVDTEHGTFLRFPTGSQLEVNANCQNTVAENRVSHFAFTEELRGFKHSVSPSPDSQPVSPRAKFAPRPEEPLSFNPDKTYPAVAPARQAMIALLSTENACSDWLTQSDSDVLETFRSLNYRILKSGPDYVVKERGDNGDWIEHGPYIASTAQNGGRGATILINANGAFFHSMGDIYMRAWSTGVPLRTGRARMIHAGPYDGGSFRAQIVTLLHELAHAVGAIPEDDPARFGVGKSQKNTELVLLHCKSDIDHAGKSPLPILTSVFPK